MQTKSELETATSELFALMRSDEDLEPTSTPPGSRSALRRCCKAWKRAYKAHMDQHEGNEIFAARSAGEAYCNAMPLLAGTDGIRDFIACTAHGINIGAISREKSTQLLYAAQLAMSVVHRDRK